MCCVGGEVPERQLLRTQRVCWCCPYTWSYLNVVVLRCRAVWFPHSPSSDVACVVVRSRQARDSTFSIHGFAFVKSAASSIHLQLERRDSGQGRRLIDRLGTFARLTRPSLHVAERLLVRDTEDCGDIVCAVSVEHVRRDLELITVVQHRLNLVDFRRWESFASTACRCRCR